MKFLILLVFCHKSCGFSLNSRFSFIVISDFAHPWLQLKILTWVWFNCFSPDFDNTWPPIRLSTTLCFELESDQGEDKQANHTQVKIDICNSTNWRHGLNLMANRVGKNLKFLTLMNARHEFQL